jgi:hypothetical protein
MRNILTAIIILMVTAAVYSQPGSGAADRKLQNAIRKVESSIKSLERLMPLPKPIGENRLNRSVESAKKDLEALKTGYPSYDSGALEKRIDDLVKELSASQEEGQADSEMQDEFVKQVNEILDFRPDTRKFISAAPDAASQTDQALANFKTEMNALITDTYKENSKKGSPRELEKITAKVTREAKGELTRLGSFDVAGIKELTNENMALSRYYNLVFTKTRFETLSLLFAEISEVGDVTRSADKLLAELGTREQVSAIARKNYAEMVAARRMSPEAQNNPALRTQFIRAFKSNYALPPSMNGGSILKVHLISSDWRVERNELTGIILNRYQYAHVAVKAADGRCFLYTFTMKQNNNGGSWGRGIAAGNSEVEMLCENVPK